VNPSLSVLNRRLVSIDYPRGSGCLLSPCEACDDAKDNGGIGSLGIRRCSSTFITINDIVHPQTHIVHPVYLPPSHDRRDDPFENHKNNILLAPSQIPPMSHHPSFRVLTCQLKIESQPDDPASKGIRPGTKFTSTPFLPSSPSHRNTVDPGRDPGSFPFQRERSRERGKGGGGSSSPSSARIRSQTLAAFRRINLG